MMVWNKKLREEGNSMDFLFTQMYGPGFGPKSDLCSYLWDWDLTEDGDRIYFLPATPAPIPALVQG